MYGTYERSYSSKYGEKKETERVKREDVIKDISELKDISSTEVGGVYYLDGSIEIIALCKKYVAPITITATFKPE